MCYDAEASVERQIKEARYKGAPEDEIQFLIQKLRELREKKPVNNESTTSDADLTEKDLPYYYHVSGFAHPVMIIFTDYVKAQFKAAVWGFIPFWVKTNQEAYDFKKPYNSNLNVQAETMFEKRGFKDAARHRRCVIRLEAYYENHHQNKKTYPFRIYRTDDQPLYVAGIYENNTLANETTGEIQSLQSFGIVTCTANAMLAKIHNNPKMVARTGHRMLVILNEDQLADYLQPFPESDDPAEQQLFEKTILNLCQPFDEELLSYDPVRNLKKRKDMDYIGNVPEIIEPYEWPDLNMDVILK